MPPRLQHAAFLGNPARLEVRPTPWADQFLNAEALRASAMAEVLEPEAATPGAIAGAARAALAAPVPAAVLAARDEIAAMPSPAEALEQPLGRPALASRIR